MSSKLFKKVSSSDYINYKKRIAIAGEYANASTINDLNPMKTNGSQYNRNFNFIPTTATATDASNCLIYAQSYETLQDYSLGLNYIKATCDLSANVYLR
jgi:hypothetical protein